MITEQIKELKDHAIFLNKNGNSYTADLIKKAADTIEQLAAKVRKENKTEEAIALERYEDLCIFFHNDKDVLNNRKEFIDWLERMKWHVKMADELFRKNEAYQKAFEDIRADIMHLDDINPDYPMDMTVHLDRNEVLTVIDKHNPGKVGKERE